MYWLSKVSIHPISTHTNLHTLKKPQLSIALSRSLVLSVCLSVCLSLFLSLAYITQYLSSSFSLSISSLLSLSLYVTYILFSISRYNMEKFAGQPIDTLADSRRYMTHVSDGSSEHFAHA